VDDQDINNLGLKNLSESESLLQYAETFPDLDFADWHADSARQHEETIEADRSTAQEQVPFNVQSVSCLL
jgi:hypothetical protein